MKYSTAALLFLFSAGTILSSADAPASAQSPGTVKTSGTAKTPPLVIDEEAYSSMADFLSALAIIRTHYVDADKISYRSLFQAALRGLMKELDPFSMYEAPEDFKAFRDSTSGKLVGIGVTLASQRQGAIEIISVLPGAPAEKAGLKSGDILLEVDGTSTSSGDLSDVSSKIRGENGTEVLLTVYRASEDAKKTFRVTRGVITLGTIRGTKILPDTDGIGYFRLLQFGDTTVDDFNTALAELEKAGMTALVVDLRDNPGGRLDVVVELCSRFIPEGKPVVSIEGRDSKQVLNAVGGKKYSDLPLVVLINGNSASASEIFSACMRDYRRAVLIGERSFGKGSVQTIIPFGRNPANGQPGALRLTTAKYFTPGRHPIHGHGVEPDILVPLSPAQRIALSMQLNTHPGEIKPLTPNPVRDIPLERATEILKGMRILHSGQNMDTLQKTNHKESEKK